MKKALREPSAALAPTYQASYNEDGEGKKAHGFAKTGWWRQEQFVNETSWSQRRGLRKAGEPVRGVLP